LPAAQHSRRGALYAREHIVDRSTLGHEYVALAHGAHEARTLHDVEHLSFETADDERNAVLPQLRRQIAQRFHARRVEMVDAVRSDHDVLHARRLALELQHRVFEKRSVREIQRRVEAQYADLRMQWRELVMAGIAQRSIRMEA